MHHLKYENQHCILVDLPTLEQYAFASLINQMKYQAARIKGGAKNLSTSANYGSFTFNFAGVAEAENVTDFVSARIEDAYRSLRQSVKMVKAYSSIQVLGHAAPVTFIRTEYIPGAHPIPVLFIRDIVLGAYSTIRETHEFLSKVIDDNPGSLKDVKLPEDFFFPRFEIEYKGESFELQLDKENCYELAVNDFYAINAANNVSTRIGDDELEIPIWSLTDQIRVLQERVKSMSAFELACWMNETVMGLRTIGFFYAADHNVKLIVQALKSSKTRNQEKKDVISLLIDQFENRNIFSEDVLRASHIRLINSQR